MSESRREAHRRWVRQNPLKYKRSQWWGTIKHRYGLTEQQYIDLRIEQGHACAICERPFEHRTPDVDHCHDTGRVRGLLCRSCNIGIGLLGGSTKGLRAAIHYLEKI